MTKSNFATIEIDALGAVTGGYHDPPEPTRTPAPQGCAIGEPHPKSFEQKIGDYAKRVAPWIQMFSR